MKLSVRTIQADCHPQIKRLLWFVFAGSRGGLNRIRIVLLLKKRPYNTHQLSNELGLDYKSIQHHLRVLERNSLITSSGQKYAATYFISTFLEIHLNVFEEIVTRLENMKVKCSECKEDAQLEHGRTSCALNSTTRLFIGQQPCQ